MVNVSVIIPTYKRKNSLIRLLRSLKDEVSGNDEIIIVEQGENNRKDYPAILHTFPAKWTYVYEKHKGTSIAKNRGAKTAKGTYLVFFDDDVVVQKGCIAHLVANLSDATIGIVGGRVLTPGQKIEKNREDVGEISVLSGFSDGFSSTIRQDVDTIIGCNMAVRKNVFDKVGGFDRKFEGAFREESDLCLRIKNLNFRILFEPEAVVTHMREPSGGARKTEGRLNWYHMFFTNETYFFLKHRPLCLFPVFLLTRISYILRCMFGFGREVSVRSMKTPFLGIFDGIKNYYDYRH